MLPADYPDKHQVANIKDVARAAGVGIATVSRALNGQEGVSANTRKRIEEIAATLGYQPNRHARFLKLHSNRTIAVVIKGLENPLFVRILDQLEKTIRSHEYQVNIVSVPHWSDEMRDAIQTVDEDSALGVIFLGAHFQHRVDDLEKLSVPFVVSTVSMKDNEHRERYASVSIDDFEEAGHVVDYLYHLGHRQIGIIGSDSLDNSVGSLRLAGYLDALHRHGIEPHPLWVRSFDNSEDSPYSFENGYRMTRSLLQECPDVTAIFAIADVLAIGAMQAAREMNLCIPRDISIVGFDGIPLGSYVYPALTTVQQPADEIAEITCNLLFSQLNGAQPRHIIVSGQLVSKGTTAAPCAAFCSEREQIARHN